MSQTKDTSSNLPHHIEETLQSVAQLHAEHTNSATSTERVIEKTTVNLGRPKFIAVLTIFIVLWVCLNLIAARFGLKPPDPFPFSWLQGIISVASLYTALLILTTQQRENHMTKIREQLNLELTLLSEQKIAKVIKLLEELRQDHPQIVNRIDMEAKAMAEPADPTSVVHAIKDIHADSLL